MSIKQIEADIAAGTWKPPEEKLRSTLERNLSRHDDCECSEWCKGFTAALQCIKDVLEKTKG